VGGLGWAMAVHTAATADACLQAGWRKAINVRRSPRGESLPTVSATAPPTKSAAVPNTHLNPPHGKVPPHKGLDLDGGCDAAAGVGHQPLAPPQHAPHDGLHAHDGHHTLFLVGEAGCETEGPPCQKPPHDALERDTERGIPARVLQDATPLPIDSARACACDGLLRPCLPPSPTYLYCQYRPHT
jgi:hypothetical protein